MCANTCSEVRVSPPAAEEGEEEEAGLLDAAGVAGDAGEGAAAGAAAGAGTSAAWAGTTADATAASTAAAGTGALV